MNEGEREGSGCYVGWDDSDESELQIDFAASGDFHSKCRSYYYRHSFSLWSLLFVAHNRDHGFGRGRNVEAENEPLRCAAVEATASATSYLVHLCLLYGFSSLLRH